jgi:DNA polymerase I-like protein with 3'-5' exonuclease and polymerase domains
MMPCHSLSHTQVAPGEREVVEQLVRSCMAGADGGLLCVPLTVDVAVGESWGEAQ